MVGSGVEMFNDFSEADFVDPRCGILKLDYKHVERPLI